MHIAIDDTHGPNVPDVSKYVTSRRRTQVAVVFDDCEVDYVRSQLRECLADLREVAQVEVDELHFAEIYNRRGVWGRLQGEVNLKLFAFFGEIYLSHRWPVIVQTVDKRTIKDLKGLDRELKFDGLNPTDPSDLALALLCLRIRIQFKTLVEPLTVIVDEGPRRKAGSQFGKELFRNWPAAFNGHYASSRTEGLLQIADFLAFCINRNTHLSLKASRTNIDWWFLNLVAEMRINSNELLPVLTDQTFSIEEFDQWHRRHRHLKGIPD